MAKTFTFEVMADTAKDIRNQADIIADKFIAGSSLNYTLHIINIRPEYDIHGDIKRWHAEIKCRLNKYGFKKFTF